MAKKEEDFSAFVSETLDTIGYKWGFIQLRRERIKKTERKNKRLDTGLSTIYAGSTREGICKPYQGDNDRMIVFEEIIAAENVQQFEHKDNLSVLKLDMDDCPPGYSVLLVKKHGGRWFHHLGHDSARVQLREFIDRSCYISQSGIWCLSSDIFIRNLLSNHVKLNAADIDEKMTLKSRAGPSIPVENISNRFIGRTKTSHDNVFAMQCHCPSIFERFGHRPRRHGWPPENLLQELSQLEAHVVPVGYKRSPNQGMQWRICFTKAEIRLIESLTEPQTQVFILLKIFTKEVLKDVWDAMTSYIMKNVILWIVELMPRHRFHTDAIVLRFLDCLFFLKTCVRLGKLPNYMISDRNLLSHDEFIVKKGKLLTLLDDCIREKGSCLFRSATLKKAMTKLYKSPQSTVLDGLERDRTERTFADLHAHIQELPGFKFDNFIQHFVPVLFSGHACSADALRLLSERLPVDGFDFDTLDFEQIDKHLRFTSDLR